MAVTESALAVTAIPIGKQQHECLMDTGFPDRAFRFFALAEMALASARRGRLVQMANEGNKGAIAAIAIKEHPSRLLAATQTGITAAALLMGIYVCG
ncbi:MAG: CNNM domain-containing protein [Sulfuriferula sp.]